jgi:polysaccharide export outer membrane protein
VGAAGRGGAGIYPLTGRTTLSEIVARAGGATPNADLQRVQITRADGTRYTVNLFRLIVEGELRYDAVLDAGDTVFIPVFAAPAPAQAGAPGAPAAEVPRVYIFGEVRSPGAYAFTPNLRVSQVLAQASGLTDSGLADSVRVIRGSLDSPQIIEADIERLLQDGDRRQDVALAPNDIVLVPRTAIANWNAFLAQLRPTLEFLTLTTATISSTQGIILQQRAIDRGPFR